MIIINPQGRRIYFATPVTQSGRRTPATGEAG